MQLNFVDKLTKLGYYTHVRETGIKQEVPAIMTGTSLLPFYSADTTTKLVRALSIMQR